MTRHTHPGLFREIVEYIDMAFWVVTPDWSSVEYINPAYERIWQRPIADLYRDGRDWIEAVLDEDKPAVLAAIPDHFPTDRQAVVFPPYRIRRADGSIRWIAARAFPIRDEHGAVRYVAGIAEDISERHRQEKHLEDLAHLDALTRLPNRTLLADRMQQAMARSHRAGQHLAVCLLDLDGFKPVNDQYGHKAGDELLVQLAGRLTQAMRGDDTVARLGGDEFVLLLGNIASMIEVEDALSRILRIVATPFHLDHGHTGRVTASIGITLYPDDAEGADTLIRHADHAMYLAKQAGKNRYHLFNPVLDIRDRENHEALRRIEHALIEGQFVLHYQPIVDCRRGLAIGVEALLRWDHPILGLLTPSAFLPLIEDHDRLALDVGDWAVNTAIAQADAWRRDGLDLAMHINIFPQQFRDLDFHGRLGAILARYPDLQPKRVILEILESCTLEDSVSAIRWMKNGEAMGISHALDDFGTGYSSMTHLRHLPVHLLKIDRRFVDDMLGDPEDLAIIEAIVRLAIAFRRQVIAEGVGDREQILMLLRLGCHLVQGNALAPAMAASAIPGWLASFEPEPAWILNDAPRLARDDFQLFLAEAHHRRWLNQLLGWSRQDLRHRGAPPPLNTTDCGFGNWYFGEGRRCYGNLPEYALAGELHARVHALACHLVDLNAEDASNAPCQSEAGIREASNAFIDSLGRLRQSSATQSRHDRD